jgi:FKBP-type peptidyl-prolyl cis-trans isomerase 2
LLAAALLAACSRDGRVAQGSTVTLDYELSSGGTVIESSVGKEPLIVGQGRGELPAVVDRALLGMKPGAEKTVDLTPAEGFGTPDPAQIQTIPLEKFGAMAKDLKPGLTVAGVSAGKPAEGRVVKIENGTATLDFNHPLAGKALRYKLKIVSTRAP